jgi:hypothetical protein
MQPVRKRLTRPKPAALGALVAIAVVAVLAFVAPGRGGYTGADRTRFISGCTQNGGATAAQCGCMFARISARLPHDAYVKAADKSWSLPTSRAFTDAVRACAGGPEPAAPSS